MLGNLKACDRYNEGASKQEMQNVVLKKKHPKISRHNSLYNKVLLQMITFCFKYAYFKCKAVFCIELPCFYWTKCLSKRCMNVAFFLFIKKSKRFVLHKS